jgi:predicted DNA-binding transcriptional regulator AlpA
MESTVTATPKPAAAQPLVTLRMEALTKKLSASRGTIYDLLKDANSGFPSGFSYGGRGVYYFEHEVDAWLLQQKAQNPVRPNLTH